jgi:hypothetical protein
VIGTIDPLLNVVPAIEIEIVKEVVGAFTVALAEPVPVDALSAATTLTAYVAAAVPAGTVLLMVAEPADPGPRVNEFAEKAVGQPMGVVDERSNFLEAQAAVWSQIWCTGHYRQDKHPGSRETY